MVVDSWVELNAWYGSQEMLIVCLRERVNMTDKTFFLLAIDPDTVVEQREWVNSALRLLLQPCLLSQCFLLDIIITLLSLCGMMQCVHRIACTQPVHAATSTAWRWQKERKRKKRNKKEKPEREEEGGEEYSSTMRITEVCDYCLCVSEQAKVKAGVVQEGHRSVLSQGNTSPPWYHSLFLPH